MYYIYGNYICVYICTVYTQCAPPPPFFVLSYVDGHSGCSRVSAVVNNAAVNEGGVRESEKGN